LIYTFDILDTAVGVFQLFCYVCHTSMMSVWLLPLAVDLFCIMQFAIFMQHLGYIGWS